MNRHSRAGGNSVCPVRKLIGQNGYYRFYLLDTHFRAMTGSQLSFKLPVYLRNDQILTARGIYCKITQTVCWHNYEQTAICEP